MLFCFPSPFLMWLLVCKHNYMNGKESCLKGSWTPQLQVLRWQRCGMLRVERQDHSPLTSGSLSTISMYVGLFFGPSPVAHSFGLFACHQFVRGVVLWSTTPCSRFRPLRVPSGCTCCRYLKCHPLLTVSASSRAISLYVVSFLWSTTPCSRFRPLRVHHQPVRGVVLLKHHPLLTVSASSRAIRLYVVSFFEIASPTCSRFRPLRVLSGSTWCRSLKHHPLLTVSASSRAISMYVVSFFEASPCSSLGPLRVPPGCTWCRSLKHHPLLTVAASSCAISMYVVSSFEAQALAHDVGLFMCHQYVRGVVLWSTTTCSRLGPLRVPPGCTWCRSLKHHPLLTVSASSRAISMYVLSFFEAPPLPHGCGLFACHQGVRGVVLWSTTRLLTVSASSRAISMYVVSFFDAPPLAHGFGFFACHAYVRGVVLRSTTPCSRFRSLCVPSVCMWCRSLKHHPCSRFRPLREIAIRMYVVSFFEAPPLAHGFGLFACHQDVRGFVLWTITPCSRFHGLFACHQGVRGVVLWTITPCSRFRPLRVPSACTWCRSLKQHPLLTVSASTRAIRLYVVSFFEAPPLDLSIPNSSWQSPSFVCAFREYVVSFCETPTSVLRLSRLLALSRK